ncbi:TPA: alpha/beta hydrolase [bacterium]|nr:alpha/beta hydrolase [bacterium]
MDQEKRRKELYNLLGDLPDRDRKITVTKIEEIDKGDYILEKLILDLNGIEPVPAYLAMPKNRKGKIPAVLYNHAHGGDYLLGKREFTEGRSALQEPVYSKLLTDLGYCALCMDTWIFGERHKRTESSVFKEMIWKGQVLWGMMVFDSIKGIDYLSSRDEIDANRIATMGISMGSTMAWWVSALDTRIKVCIDICCLTDFHTLIETDGLDGHGIYYYVPNLLRHFTTAQINSLIAPRAHLGLAGDLDSLTPPKGLDIIDTELKEVYSSLGVPNKWKLLRYDVGHQETPAMREEIIAFLREWL